MVADSSSTRSKSSLYGEMLLLSALSLYVELLVIKWLSADIRGFTIFRSFPLVACFIGIGVGYALRNKGVFNKAPLALFQTVLFTKAAEWLGLAFIGFPSASVFVFQKMSLSGLGDWGNVGFFMLFLVLILSGPFALCACIGSRMGELFDELKPLPAYAYNLGGAFFGSILFTFLSFLRFSPSLLLILPCLIFAAFAVKNSDKKLTAASIVALVAAPLIAMINSGNNEMPLWGNLTTPIKSVGSVIWSPYQRLDLTVFQPPEEGQKEQFLGFELGTNRSFYQYFFNPDFDISNALPTLKLLLSERKEQYAMPFKLQKANDVLIVGAGTGQDVAAAVQNGATSIDGIEIDPCIVEIGKKYNPYYSNPKVNIVCDDARHYLRTCNKKYDRICFTLLDSHTVAGLGSSVRLDAYIYTKESIRSALKLLKPDGLLVLSFATNKDYIADRLFYTLKEAAGYPPLVRARGDFKIWGSPFFILGEPARTGTLKFPDKWIEAGVPKGPQGHILTDDWPYLYVDTSVIDFPFIAIMIETLLICFWATRKVVFKDSLPIYWQMLFLGAGFLLMELTSIAKLSLLFGSTWLTAALVINSILAMIFVANLLVFKFEISLRKALPILYALIGLALIASYMIPVEGLLEKSTANAANDIITLVIVILPLFVAGLIFPSAFAQAPSAPKALTFNILGAIMGSFFEYFSNLYGINSLVLVSLALYSGAFLCCMIGRSKTA
jgi:SAM-dependent methyltransferase